MAADDRKQVLRLRKKHAPGSHERPVVEDGERLVRAQSLGSAVLAALVVSIAFALVWAMLSALLGRVFPWMTLLLGYLLGFAVRRGGQGLDWRFPTLAAVLTLLGATVGNIVVGAAFAGEELGTGTLTVLRRTTTSTWPIFFKEVMTVADIIFALVAAAIAAFFANRRLNRQEFHALRIWQQQNMKRKGRQ